MVFCLLSLLIEARRTLCARFGGRQFAVGTNFASTVARCQSSYTSLTSFFIFTQQSQNGERTLSARRKQSSPVDAGGVPLKATSGSGKIACAERGTTYLRSAAHPETRASCLRAAGRTCCSALNSRAVRHLESRFHQYAVRKQSINCTT